MKTTKPSRRLHMTCRMALVSISSSRTTAAAAALCWGSKQTNTMRPSYSALVVRSADYADAPPAIQLYWPLVHANAAQQTAAKAPVSGHFDYLPRAAGCSADSSNMLCVVLCCAVVLCVVVNVLQTPMCGASSSWRASCSTCALGCTSCRPRCSHSRYTATPS